MKVLFITLLVVAGAFARSAVQQEINAEGPRCPIDDPLRVEQAAINVTVHPILNLEIGSEVVNLVAEGLSTLWYKVELNAIALTATFEVKITRVTGNATFKADGYLDARPFRQETVPSGNLTGGGVGKVSATDVNLKGSASVFINLQGKVQVSRLVIDTASFATLSVDLGTTFTIGGGAVDWAELNRNLKANFDRDLADNKNAIQEKIRAGANGILGKYSLQELIDLLNPPDGGEPCDA